MEKAVLILLFATCLVLTIESKWLSLYDKNNLCLGLNDGKHVIADVFGYLKCEKGRGFYKKCKNGKLFNPTSNECEDGSLLFTELLFCKNRPNGSYRDPWECNKFITCVGEESVKQSCPSETRYDPYEDVCKQMPCETIAGSRINSVDVDCRRMPNGDYATANVFNYVTCHNNNTIHKHCNPDPTKAVLQKIFDAVTSKCVDASAISFDVICRSRKVGNYNNPWNCHTFITCVHNTSVLMDCQDMSFVYSTVYNYCDQHTKCQQVKKDDRIEEIPTADNPCAQLDDGVYPVRDVFKYLTCKDHQTKYTNCGENQFFDAGTLKCIDASGQQPDAFCANRTNGDWLDPWNCHQLFKCLSKRTYPVPCQSSTLVYDPYKDQCVYPEQYECKQLSAPRQSAVERIKNKAIASSSQCDGKPDGVYPLADVFKYLNCSKGKAYDGECDTNMIFEPGQKKCVSISTQSIYTFCQNRTDCDYRNPWACHRFIECKTRVAVNKPCPLDWLVFNPEKDACTTTFPCNQVGESLEADNPCAHLDDGVYPVRDVFKYLTCKDHQTTYTNCGKNQFFDAGTLKCVDASTQDPDAFCANRTHGDWLDPWNCHQFFKCFFRMTFTIHCQISTLVYDPDKDQCVYPAQHKCKQVPTRQQTYATIADDFCKDKADGQYAIPDVFYYISCKGHKSTKNKCEDEYIYSPSAKECVSASSQSIYGFCEGRDDGDWRNPWNCHSSITCASGSSKILPCLINDFVFDTDNDVCRKDIVCQQLPSFAVYTVDMENEQKDPELDCSRKSDGYYGIRDTMSYLFCERHVRAILSCEDGYVYEKLLGRCVNATTVSAHSFCLKQPNGNFRNPWDCHGFITCVNGRAIEEKCANKHLVYDPYNDLCEWSPRFQCKQYHRHPKTPNLFPPFANDDYCKDATTFQPFVDKLLVCTDPFKYINCTNGTARLIPCPLTQIFIPEIMKCSNPNYPPKRNESSFCQDRLHIGNAAYGNSSGQYLDPWNCHSQLACLADHAVLVPCQTQPPLIYNPVIEHCVYNHTCQNIVPDVVRAKNNVREKPEAFKQRAVNSVQIKDICTTLEDGIYAIRDVLQYLECKNHTSKTVDCPKGTIYIPGNKNCTNATKVTQDTFCENRVEGNWRNPWNCHEYYTCRFAHPIHVEKCNHFVVLNYDPVFDVCDYPSVVPCKTLPPSDEKNIAAPTKNTESEKQADVAIEANDFCKGKADGKYPIPDVFSYIQCKGGKSTKIKCPSEDIFSQYKMDCVSISSQSFTQFCRARSNGIDWRNPWDCTSYILCKTGVSQKRKCLINGFVFDPDMDVCVKSSTYPCYQVGDANHNKEQQNGAPTIAIDDTNSIKMKDICTTLPDGKYAFRDVLQYLQCKNHSTHFVDCPEKTIYVSGENCTNASKFTEENFCHDRVDGNWRNPWDCHTYFTCHAHRTFKRICNPILTLNYDPIMDVCEYPAKIECKQLTQSKTLKALEMVQAKKVSTKATDPCESLKDGLYAVRDVAKYLYCHFNHGHIFSCASGKIFVPGPNKCVPISTVKKITFCEGRKDGNYRNPWNCHSYFTCHADATFERPCSVKTILNYSPDVDQCLFPFEQKCVNISASMEKAEQPEQLFGKINTSKASPNAADPCKTLKDGLYAVRDVAKYLYCHFNHGHIFSCASGKIFVPGPNKCVPISTVKKITFCEGRKDGNYRNPWNCHSYFTCHTDATFERPCSVKTILNYSPDVDQCLFPFEQKCVNISASMEKAEQPEQLFGKINTPKASPNAADPCKTLKDGLYAVRDVAKYLYCHFNHGHIFSCASGKIFVPGPNKCVPISTVKKITFCEGRKDGNYRNPWNCHSYFTCHAEATFERPCSVKTILNYSPDVDQCLFPFEQKCVNISASMEKAGKPVQLYEKINTQKTFPKPADPCANLENGKYAVRDVAKYLSCYFHHGHIDSCALGRIFVPGPSKCVRISTVDKITFCEGRKDGNYRNPWNCHNYLTCHADATFDRPCSIKTTLNYSPDVDQCLLPSEQKCVNISDSMATFHQSLLSPILNGESCSQLSDGKYAIRDVFMYLECSDHMGVIKSCNVGTYFDAVTKECVQSKEKLDANSFCRGRSTGNWGNPWNCHNYITCTAAQGYDRPCSLDTVLNYNPHEDICEFPEKHLCKQLPPTKSHLKIVEEIIQSERIIL